MLRVYRWERMQTLDMEPAQELRGLPGVEWWRLELELPEVSANSATPML